MKLLAGFVLSLSYMTLTSARDFDVGVCDDAFLNCKCGTNPGYDFRIKVKQCSHVHRWQLRCRPCDDKEENKVCPAYLACQECQDGINDRCVSCPVGKWGAWCSGVCTCQNGGICDRDTGACTCPENFEGKDCEKRKIVTCGPPEAPLNGGLEGFIGEEGTNVTYTCNSGFALIGNRVRTCTNNRSWTGTLPKCAPVCTLPAASKGLTIKTNPSIKDGNEIIRELLFSCSSGLQLLGPKQLTCKSPGNWGSPIPVCISACFKPLAPTFGSVEIARIVDGDMDSPNDRDMVNGTSMNSLTASQLSLADKQGFVQVGTRAIYSCKSRFYSLKGPMNRMCSANASWTGRQPTCELVCGKSPGIKSPTIINGTVSDVGQWPWQAAIVLQVPSTDSWILACGGALVNQNWVVTAAHCVTEKDSNKLRNISQMRIYLGKHHRDDSKDDKQVQIRRVSVVLIHPNYHPQSLDSDLALIELSQAAKLTARVLPICLPDASEVDVQEQLREGSEGMVTGWGIVGSGLASDVLQHVNLPVVPKRKCEEDYARTSYTVTVTANMYCAGFENGEIGTCTGDSGGPMVFKTGSGPDVKYVLMGLLSWGGIDGCAIPHQYSGFTHVYEFLNWIYQYI